MKNIECRLAKNDASDGLAFCKLYNSLYTKKVDVGYYTWQFFDTPFPSLLCCVTESGDPVGFYGLHVTQCNQGEAKTAWVLDMMVSPLHRGSGLFRKLGQYAERQLAEHQPVGAFVMANDQGAGAVVGKNGWRKINEYVSCVASTTATSAPEDGRLGFVQVATIRDVVCADNFLQRDSRLFAVKRDGTYMRWRYTNNPRFSYDQFEVTKGDEPFGYLVLKSFKDPHTTETFGDIVDFGWREDDSEALAEMLGFSLRHFNRLGIRQALTWTQTNTLFDSIAAEAGFCPINQKRFFCGKILGDEYRDLMNPESWFATLSDSEIY